MELLTYKFTLDTHKNGVQHVLQGFETGDNVDRVLQFSLTASGEPVELPSGCTATLYIKTPSITGANTRPCTIEDSTIYCTLADEDVAEEGIVECQAEIIQPSLGGSDGVLISPRFNLEVWESIVVASNPQDSPTYKSLIEAVARAYATMPITSIYLDDDHIFTVEAGVKEDGSVNVVYTSSVIKDALADISKVTEYVEEAKGYRDEAETSATSASGYADTASGYADTAEGYRDEAKKYRDEAEGFAPEGYSALVSKVDTIDADLTTAEGNIASLQTSLNAISFTDYTATLTDHSATITAGSEITDDNTIEVYSDVYGEHPTNVTVSGNTITVTFSSSSTSASVKVRVY